MTTDEFVLKLCFLTFLDKLYVYNVKQHSDKILRREQKLFYKIICKLYRLFNVLVKNIMNEMLS